MIFGELLKFFGILNSKILFVFLIKELKEKNGKCGFINRRKNRKISKKAVLFTVNQKSKTKKIKPSI
jgi:Holliday junction resolvase-like predicted endonuclease